MVIKTGCRLAQVVTLSQGGAVVVVNGFVCKNVRLNKLFVSNLDLNLSWCNVLFIFG